MNLNLINKYPKIKRWVVSNLGYYFNGMYSLNDNTYQKASNQKIRIAIIAKAHYKEHWQSFSSTSRKDLLKIIALKKNTVSDKNYITQIFENKNIDGFNVKTTTFSQMVLNDLGGKIVLIPETELIVNNDSEPKVYQLETVAGTLFFGGFGNKATSSYAQGIMSDIEVFKLSAGLPDDTKTNIINKQEFNPFITTQLLVQKFDLLLRKSFYQPRKWFSLNRLHLLYVAPLITMLCFYIFSNGYLFLQTHKIEQKLSQGGSQVNQLLIQKQELDRKIEVLSVISAEFSEQHLVHYYWEIVFQLVNQGMIITKISFDKGELDIRGRADKASEVLSNIVTNKYVVSAVFDGSVRNYRDKDDFTLKIMPKVKS